MEKTRGSPHSGRLDICLFPKNPQRSKVVLNLLKASQHCLSVGRDCRIIGSLGLVIGCTPTASIEDGLRCRCSDGPHRTWPLKQSRDASALEPASAEDIHQRIISSLREADLGVSRCYEALGGGNIRTSLE